ncbi:MAG TPA: hypothetical protein VMT93_10975 [Gemmatimonadaceae bacterium]|nr:hypothetical protein [Gemmatimonadaceae bacterium]
MRFRSAPLVCLALAAAPLALAAQATASPRDVVQESFNALAQRDWDGVAGYASPQFLDQFRQKQLFYAEDDERQRMEKKKNPDSYGLPKCVQKYFESQQGNFSKRFLENFAGVDNLLQLEVLTPAQFFAAWLAGTKNLKKEDLAAAPRIVIPTRTIFGEVMEGDSVAHVLYRRVPSPPGDPDQGVKLITLRRYDGVWKIYPNDDMILAGRSFAWWSIEK